MEGWYFVIIDYNSEYFLSPLSGQLADGIRGQRCEAGLGLEARVRPLRVGAGHADTYYCGQPAGTGQLSRL